MGKTSYISKWEEGRPWLKPVKGKTGKAHCFYAISHLT